MHYREATPSDARTIASLHAESWRVSYRGAYRDEFLDGPVDEDRIFVWKERFSARRADQFVVLAEAEGRAVGFACAYGGEDERWGTLLDNIHVLPDGQRRGTGSGLVSAVGVWCRANHPDCGIYLWVLEGNDKARRFYESLGASDRGGAVFVPPGGGEIRSRRYSWDSPLEVPELGER